MKKLLFDKGWKYIEKDLEPRCPESGWGGASLASAKFELLSTKGLLLGNFSRYIH